MVKKDELDIVNNMGVKRAAQRRVNYELGIEMSKLNLDSFHYLTRIHYKADNVPYDGIFGEHEIDYCIILKGDFNLNPNKNEIKATRYLSMYELKELLELEKERDSGVLLTPWFKMICHQFLFKWWSNLDNIEAIKDYSKIHRFL